jgi:hypothetical protein
MIGSVPERFLYGNGPASLALGGVFVAAATLAMGNMKIEEMTRSYLVERMAGSQWHVESVAVPISAMFASSFTVKAVVEDGASHKTIEAKVTGRCLAASGCLMEALPDL